MSFRLKLSSLSKKYKSLSILNSGRLFVLLELPCAVRVNLMTATTNLVVPDRLWSPFFILFEGVVDSEIAVLYSARQIDVLVTRFVVDAVDAQIVLLVVVEVLVKLFAQLEQVVEGLVLKVVGRVD